MEIHLIVDVEPVDGRYFDIEANSRILVFYSYLGDGAYEMHFVRTNDRDSEVDKGTVMYQLLERNNEVFCANVEEYRQARLAMETEQP
jgi:hypothetical protein